MTSNLEKIDHIVVLMLENRSFDNMLGWLGAKNGKTQKVNGVAGKQLSNPIPSYAEKPKGQKTVPVNRGHVMTNPSPDPGEEYYHVSRVEGRHYCHSFPLRTVHETFASHGSSLPYRFR